MHLGSVPSYLPYLRQSTLKINYQQHLYPNNVTNTSIGLKLLASIQQIFQILFGFVCPWLRVYIAANLVPYVLWLD